MNCTHLTYLLYMCTYAETKLVLKLQNKISYITEMDKLHKRMQNHQLQRPTTTMRSSVITIIKIINVSIISSVALGSV